MPATDHYWRSLGTMHMVFAVSAILLLACTIWMMANDHRDEWRQYQATADALKAAQLNEELSEIQSEAYQERKAELKEQQEAAEQSLEAKAGEIETLNEQIAELQGEVDLLTRQVKFKGAERDVARADYDIAVRDERPDAELQILKAKFDDLQAAVDEMSLQLDAKTQELGQAQGELSAATVEYDSVAEELKALDTDAQLVADALTTIDPPPGSLSRFKRWLMLQPIIDGFNSPHGIQQEWLPDLPITYGMATTDRFDRCRTCHVNINDFRAGNVPGFPHGQFADGKYPHPYSSHPDPDVYVSSTSPHPMPSFGCTICHDGDGSGTSFQNAEHTPNDPAQAEHWHSEYGWHANHFWEYPMQPDRFIESSCIKCHHSVVELGVNKQYGATAPKVFEGYELIKTYGCFGCHEINGYNGDERIGPDLRLEPNVVPTALQLLADPAVRRLDEVPAVRGGPGLMSRVDALQARAETALESPQERAEFVNRIAEVSDAIVGEAAALAHRLAGEEVVLSDRQQLLELLNAATTLADLDRRQRLLLPEEIRENVPAANQLSPLSLGLVGALKDDPHPGEMRKVGPSLRHVASKTTPEFIAYWTEMPSRFRPSTRMPQFFHLSNQQDELAQKYQPVQIAAIAAYLQAKSQPLELEQPQDGYEPSAERGKELFARRGCLACHSHDDAAFEGATADFGPNLTNVHEKIKPGEDGFRWLYTWLRDPTRHHSRTRMPDLFLNPEGEGDNYVDPAADIAAFLLDGGPREFPDLSIDEQVLDELVAIFAGMDPDGSRFQTMMSDHAFPAPAASIRGDEIELARHPGDPEQISDEQWRERKIQYVGRRTINYYGCFGCHDIPEFETARPIGTTLQDWGRKDRSKLAFEHIEEFLHHHSEVPERAERATQRQIHDGDADPGDLSTAYFYDALLHHDRPGFIWQKLRQPRSYDFRKIETKGYDERLRMPKFPLDEQQIEAITTFVLGLVAEPPPEQYLFRPDTPKADTIEGERLLAKYNCAGCHMLDLPEAKYRLNPEKFVESRLGSGDYQEALDLLLEIKPPRNGVTGEEVPGGKPGEEIVSFHGLLFAEPDFREDPEFQEYSYDLWETLEVDGKRRLPGSKMLVPAANLVERKPARGGDFAQWLVPRLMETDTNGNRYLAWQASPPPLYQEGAKVQTPWLYSFLKNPDRLRYTTVLRMPKFNMSDDEARALANYFAAADGVPYPYQSIPQQQSPYLTAMQSQFQAHADEPASDYLGTSWKLLNAPLCIKCHSVGGNEYQSTNPQEDIRGPDLDRVAKRLRPDWLLLWLYKPAWITPYTSMPAVFPRNQEQLTELFDGDGSRQTVAVRDALMNYYDLMEVHGRLAYTPPESEPDAAAQQTTGSGGE